MAALVAQRARTGQLFLMPPCKRQGGVEQDILIIGRMHAHDFTQLSGLHQFLDILVGRIHDIGKSTVIDNALFAGQLRQLLRLLRRKGKRLFAENMLAILHRCLDHVIVHAVGRCHIHQIDFRIANDLGPVGRITVIAHGGGKFRNGFFIYIAYQLKNRHIIAENHACIVERNGMCFAHPSGANQPDFYLVHIQSPLLVCCPRSGRQTAALFICITASCFAHLG